MRWLHGSVELGESANLAVCIPFLEKTPTESCFSPAGTSIAFKYTQHSSIEMPFPSLSARESTEMVGSPAFSSRLPCLSGFLMALFNSDNASSSTVLSRIVQRTRLSGCKRRKSAASSQPEYSLLKIRDTWIDSKSAGVSNPAAAFSAY